MATLRKNDPDLYQTFYKCLGIAREAMGPAVQEEWRRFQTQGREKRRRLGYTEGDVGGTPFYGSLDTMDPTRRNLVQAVYRGFQDVSRAVTVTWKGYFQYRRACVHLFRHFEAYADLYDDQSSLAERRSHEDRIGLLRTLFREMQPDWRNVLPENFSEEQVKERGYGAEWSTLNDAVRYGRRWNILVQELGLGALLLINTTDNISYLQRRLPYPAFAAWVDLIRRIRPNIRQVAERVQGCYEGMEEDALYAMRPVRPLKLERHAYRTCSPDVQFEFSGSEGRRTPTADPNNLMLPSQAMEMEENAAMEELLNAPYDEEDE